MDTTSFPPDSLYARLHGNAAARTTPILIPRHLAGDWSPGAGSEGRKDARAKWIAAGVVLAIALLAAAFVLA
jgi:hypothetical protein